MRLVRLDLLGFKRFRAASVNLDGKVIAIVGPNEAGKSTLLDAILLLHSPTEIRPVQVFRGSTYPSGHSYLEGLYLLEDSDFEGWDLKGALDRPRWMEVHWEGKETHAIRFRPAPNRDLGPRDAVAAHIKRVAKTRHAMEYFIEPSSDDATPIDHLANAAEALQSRENKLPSSALESLVALRAAIPAAPPPLVRQLAERLSSLITTESDAAPEELAREMLTARTPSILVFGEDERNLASEYTLTAELIATPPAALSNLVQLAGISLSDLYAATQSGERARVATVLEKANKRLADAFAHRWKQANVAVHFDVDGTVVHILVSNPQGGFSSIAERSDGLRTFVALAAFVAQSGPKHGLILLIDEAENHLHYDAQADLVRMLTRQTEAQQVFYTTHSIGCLPNDLGSGIRVVVPDDRLQESFIRNSFWTGGPGLTPLMLGMGASVFAFTPTRNAVISEGGADAILLPTLIRQSTGLEDLNYQIASGLAQIAPDAVASLTAEAGRVVFLVDGDDAGREIAKKLEKAKIPTDRILTLRNDRDGGLTPEDLVSADAFAAAVNEELRRSNLDVTAMQPGSIPATGRCRWLASWGKQVGIDPPSRVGVANQLVESGRTSRIVAASQRKTLSNLHRQIEHALASVR